MKLMMPRFIALDGLRAWMAWIVVSTHIVQQGLPDAGGKTWIDLDIGGEAVNVFIIISGFVITHLLIERPSPYFAYLISRFMRLFPAFFVSCIMGGVAYEFAARWSSPSWFAPLHSAGYRTMAEYLPAHILTHISMLHGLIPNTILPDSEYALNPPGWSVSLEWQFYVLAPSIIWMCRNKDRAFLLVVLVVICGLVYHHELRTLFERPSILIGAAKFFLVGIACRFAAPGLAGRVTFVTATGAGLGFTALWMGAPSIAVWIIAFSFILKGHVPAAGIDRFYTALMRSLLESRPVLFFAERSYSSYLLHWPILTFIGTLATSYGVTPGKNLVAIMILGIPCTMILQEITYRFVEVPGRVLGKRWSTRFGGVPVIEEAREVVIGSNVARYGC